MSGEDVRHRAGAESDETAEDGSGRHDAEARKSKRRSCRLKLRCRRLKGVGLYGSGEEYIEGRVIEQSQGGLRLETPIWYPEGAKLEVSFNSPDDKQSFLGVVEVKWVKKVGEFFDIGVVTKDMQHF